jgi:hypothetical protein
MLGLRPRQPKEEEGGAETQFQPTLVGQAGLEPADTAAAGFGVHHYFDQIPFLATLVISFMNWNANYPQDISFGTLNNYLHGLHRCRLCGPVCSSPSC